MVPARLCALRVVIGSAQPGAVEVGPGHGGGRVLVAEPAFTRESDSGLEHAAEERQLDVDGDVIAKQLARRRHAGGRFGWAR